MSQRIGTPLSWLAGRRERAAARAELHIPHTERTVAIGRDLHDQPVLATSDACYWVSAGDIQRVAWSQVLQARWDEPVLTLVTEDGAPPTAVNPDVQTVLVQLSAPGSLPDAVHACVTESVVFSERVAIDAGVVLLVARRLPERSVDSGEVSWTLAFEEGVDGSDPEVRAQAEAALSAIRTALGV